VFHPCSTCHSEDFQSEESVVPTVVCQQRTNRFLTARAIRNDKVDRTHSSTENVNPAHYFFGCGLLAGGMIPFIRKYSTIWP
jgi:hypothetical protein